MKRTHTNELQTQVQRAGCEAAPRAPTLPASRDAEMAAGARPPAAAGARPKTTLVARLARATVVPAAFAGVSLLVRAAVRVYFSRLHVSHGDRFPAHGPVLLIANHPAMWTDVLVLDVALRRKLHFLAQGALFDLPVRAAILRLHGALPVLHATEGAGTSARNAETFRSCRELFARGAVVALFPEGVSMTDRMVLPLKTGAARIALEQALGAPECAPAVIPTGIHYANRTAFGSTVTVSVGSPIGLAPYVALAGADPDAAIHALTEHMHAALRALILDLPEPTLAAAVADLEPLAALSARAGIWELASARRIAERIDQMRSRAPLKFAGLERHQRAYRRARRALGLSDRALLWDRWTTPWRQRFGWLVTVCALGAVPAAAGALVHAVPWAAGEVIVRKVEKDPVRISFARISSGIVFFPVAYALAMVGILQFWTLSVVQAFSVLAVFVMLGLWTLAWSVWARALAERVRLLWMERTHARLVRRARLQQRALLGMVASGREDSAGALRASP